MIRLGVMALGLLLVPPRGAATQTSGPQPLTAPPAAGWPMPARDYAGTRFSPLGELTTANVPALRLLWTFGTGSLRGHEGAPLVIGRRLYLHTPHPVAVYAFDLDQLGGPPLWKYAPPSRDPAPFLCCDGVNRGMAWHPSGRLLVPLHPGDLAALDAETGRELWRVRSGDPAAGRTMPAAPLVIGDAVVVGVAGGEFGARGHLSAHDVETGRLIWRAWSTGTDQEVLIPGPLPLGYPSSRGANLGVSTWTGDAWQRGGGSTWGWLSYDPELDLLYHGTGAPAPMHPVQRLGDNKWTSTLFAREPRTGRVRWALQLTPADAWGYDATGENILTELTVGGRSIKALVHFDRNGFAYTIDRVTGRIALAEKYGPANWATRVDTETGLPVRDPGLGSPGSPLRGICPSLLGMKTFQPAAWSPATGLFYVPGNNLCMDLDYEPASFTPGRPFLGATVRLMPGPGGNRGRVIAWEATTGTIRWEVREDWPVMSGVLTTAGGLVFYGTLDGWFKALEATTGRELWRFKAPSGIMGSPISFAGPDGRQYVAVLSGLGGWPTATAAALGAVAAFAELTGQVNPGGTLLVFGL